MLAFNISKLERYSTFQLVFDSEDNANDELTTDEIKECMKDIKVLGKKEIK